MVSMIELHENRRETVSDRPRLIFHDCTQMPPAAPALRPLRRTFRRVENALLASAATAVVGYFVAVFALSWVHSVQQSYAVSALPQSVTISKAVKRGDTLTSLARRYGNPNVYILQREDQIARTNHLSGKMPLLPGQHLQIPVTNPAVIAQIVHASHSPLVASR